MKNGVTNGMSSQTLEPEHHPSAPPSQPAEPCSGHGGPSPCLDLPELKRLQYFYGQVLGPQDFQDEQTYFREKLKLHNRCLHGYGVVCGLEVVPAPLPEDCDPPGPGPRARLEQEIGELQKKLDATTDPAARKALEEQLEELRRRLRCLPQDCGKPIPRTRVVIRCGLAYDCAGNELVVRRDLPVDLLAHLEPKDAREVEKKAPVTLWLSLCYCEQPVDPARPVLPDACGASPDCVFGKVRDAVRVRVSLAKPDEDERCDTCCSPCADPCLLLARIDCFVPGKELAPEQIDNGVRCPLGPYVLTRIAGVSWSHGAEYTVKEARKLLQKEGIEVRFTRPVLTSTLKRGVVDLWVIEGGAGRSGNIYHMAGDYVDLPADPTTRGFRFRQTSGETLQQADRVLVIIRTSFLLDACCRAVDGDHLGGRVPNFRVVEPPPPLCPRPFGSFAPWTSGNGSPGGMFESWFFISHDPAQEEERS
jgi:hypothetical protein